MMDVTLMLCINDDNGNPTAKVCKVDVEICRDPLALELESKYGYSDFIVDPHVCTLHS